VREHPVVLFMKGDRDQPQCGFSAQVVQILDQLIPDYQTVDVLAHPEIREGIKEYSDWPTIPQLYIRGEFVGGCDIVREMSASGELQDTLGATPPGVEQPPAVRVTDPAARLIRDAMASSPHGDVHVKIDARFQHRLGFGPREPGQIAVESNGISLLFDPASAARADGLTLDVDPDGRGLSVDNPNQPRVRALGARELKALLDDGTPLRLLDVRTPAERARAQIPGSELLDDAAAQRIRALPRDTRLVFYCHRGGRSQQAAEQFALLGFRDVANLSGGIDAWSTEADPSVPRY
jgi:monothiol glutaredoxin